MQASKKVKFRDNSIIIIIVKNLKTLKPIDDKK